MKREGRREREEEKHKGREGRREGSRKGWSKRDSEGQGGERAGEKQTQQITSAKYAKCVRCHAHKRSSNPSTFLLVEHSNFISQTALMENDLR